MRDPSDWRDILGDPITWLVVALILAALAVWLIWDR